MVSFLHAADLHLGLRITRFDPATANKVREARFTALDNIRKVAAERRVDFILIAGDLFDDDAVDMVTARRAFEILDNAPMPVFVLSGNHDPLLAGGVWDRPPWNQVETKRVRLLRRAEPVEIGPGVVLFPCPVFRKTSLNDPTAWIALDSSDRSDLRIGLAHGSLKVRDDLPPDDHVIARHAASEKKLDYLALGHWHSRSIYPDREGVQRTAYPGVHEPIRFQGSSELGTGWLAYSAPGRAEFLDSGKGEVLHVRLAGSGQAPGIEPVEVGNFIWNEEKCELRSADELSRLISDVATRPNVERRLLRLKLAGVLDATSMLRLEELKQILEHRYLFGELDDAQLHVEPTEEEMREAAGQGVLRRVLEQLRVEARSGETQQRQVAERAILLLYLIAREANT
jgi:DNA repair exonuclease SbcCD nuclease subunit